MRRPRLSAMSAGVGLMALEDWHTHNWEQAWVIVWILDSFQELSYKRCWCGAVLM